MPPFSVFDKFLGAGIVSKFIKWGYWVSAGVAALLITGFIGFMFWGWLAQGIVEFGDVVSFLGAATGAGITVLGAFFVSELSARRRHRKNRAHLKQQMGQFLWYIDQLNPALHSEDISPSNAGRSSKEASTNCWRVIESYNLFKTTFPRYQDDSYDVLDLLLRIQSALPDTSYQQLDRLAAELRDMGDNPPAFKRKIADAHRTLEWLRKEIVELLNLLG